MTAGTWTPVNSTRTHLLDGTFDIDSDTFKVALVASTSNISASSTTFAGVTGELSTANGYTAGGIGVTLALAGTTSVTVSFASNPVWTATSSGITARWAVLYEVGGNVLGYVLLDSAPADVTATAGNTLTIDGSVSHPVFTLS